MDVNRFENLGQDVRRELDAHGAPVPSDEQRMILLEHAMRLGERPAQRSWLAPAVAAFASILLMTGIGWALSSVWTEGTAPINPPQAPITTATAERTTHWIEARSDAPERLELPDGTVFTFEPTARGRVEVEPGVAVRTTLERGEMSASVRKGQPNTWRFWAGPFQVQVIGTEFTIRWDAAEGRFELDVREGEVRVTGGPLVGAGMAVTGGQQLRANVDDGAVELGPLPDPSASGALQPEPVEADAPAPSAVVVVVPTERPGPDHPQSPPAHVAAPTEPARVVAQPEPARPTWKEAAEAGRHTEALGLARAAGIDRLIERLPPNDLLLLADCARLGGDAAAARMTLTGLRRRFPKADPAAAAAFRLGRLSGSPAEQVRWYRTYLSESPSGALASEANGRLVQALHRSGDAPAAQREARLYLERYPSGAYVAFARSVVAQDANP